MARRPRARVDTSRLRAMGETSAVVARPVDTYVRPAAPQKNQQYAQILSALSTVNPALDNFITDKVTKDREKQANLGEKSFYEATPEERKAMSAKIRSGEINELQSPFWVEGFARQLLRNHASTFGSALTLEWNKKKDSGGFDFNAFVAEERGKYVEANNLSSFRSDLFNDEFAAVTQTYERQVQQRNFEHRISQAKKARMRAWGDGMVGILEGVQTTINDKTFFDPIGGEESDSKGSLNFSGQINAHVQAIIDQGQDPKAVVQMAENFLTGTSERLANKGDRAGAETVLRMLNGLKLNVGTFGIVYKDRFAQAERNVTQLIDASEKRQDEDDEEAGEDRINEIFADIQKAGYEAEWTQEWWETTQSDRQELQRLNQEYGGSQGSALNDLYTNRGKVTQKTDPLVISELTSDITNPTEVLDSKDIRAMAEVGGLTPRETADLIALNNNLDEQLLNDLGLDTIRSDLKNSVMGANTSGGFGPNPERALIAGKATAELNDFIRQQLTKRSGLTDTEIATNIQAKADTLLQKYSNMTTNVSSGNPAGGPDGNPPPPPPAETEDGDPIVPATLKEVQSFIGGQQTPYLKPNGEFDTTFFNLDLLQAYAEAANNPTQDASKTELGQKIAYLVAGGHATPNEILGVLTAAHEKAKGVSTEAAAKALSEAAAGAGASMLENVFPTDRTALDAKVNSAIDQSEKLTEAVRPYLEPVVDAVAEFVNGDKTANPTPQDFLDFLKENGRKIPQESGDFFKMGPEYKLFEEIYGVEAFKSDDGSFSDDKVQAIFDELNELNKAEVTQGSGTISAEDPLFKQDNILNKTARAKAIAENAEELQRNYERESIDPPDNIGAINETIVDLGEGFLKAVARSFEATGKAGAERTRELQRFARQAALYKELLNNPNVEAQELTKKIDLATSQNIGIGNVDNSKQMAELLELRDPDKALAAAQKFLSPEAKIRIDNASALFGDASAADAALMLAQPYLSEEAKQRILTRFPVIKPQEAQPPVDLRGRSSPTAQTAEQEADTAGDAGKLGSSSTDTGTKVFQLKSVLEQNGKVPLLSATKDAVKGEKAKKLAIRSWKKAFGKHYRENGTAKPAFMKQALDIAQQTETDVTTVIKAVLGTNPSANKLLVTSGLTATEAQQLHKKYQEIRRLFEQMQGDNS